MRGQKLIRFRRITAFICAVLMLFGAMPAHLFEGVFEKTSVAKAYSIEVYNSVELDTTGHTNLKKGDVINPNATITAVGGEGDVKYTYVLFILNGGKREIRSNWNGNSDSYKYYWTTDKEYRVLSVDSYISGDTCSYNISLEAVGLTVTAPQPIYDLKYTGSNQALISAGSISAGTGTLYYAVGEEAPHRMFTEGYYDLSDFKEGDIIKPTVDSNNSSTELFIYGLKSLQIDSGEVVYSTPKVNKKIKIAQYGNSSKAISACGNKHSLDSQIENYEIQNSLYVKWTETEDGTNAFRVSDVNISNGTIEVERITYNSATYPVWSSTSVPSGTEVGTYRVWYKAIGTNGYADEYYADWVTVDIHKAVPVITVEPSPNYESGMNYILYDGEAHDLVTPGQTANGNFEYALGTNAEDVPDNGWTGGIPTGTEAGTYYVWYQVIGSPDEHYGNSSNFCVPVTIDYSKKSITLGENVDPDFITNMTTVNPGDNSEVVVDIANPQFYTGKQAVIVSSAMLEFYDSENNKINKKRLSLTTSTVDSNDGTTIYTYTFTMPANIDITLKHTHEFVIVPDVNEPFEFFMYGCDNESGALKTIYTLKVNNAVYTGEDVTAVYSGEAVTASVVESENVEIPAELNPSYGVVSYYSGNTLLNGAPVDAGTYVAKVTVSSALGDRTLEKEFTISTKSFDSDDITVTVTPLSKSYDGTVPTYGTDFTVTVKDGNTLLVYGEDFVVTVNPSGTTVGSNNTIRVSGIVNYTDYKEFDYEITEADVANQINFEIYDDTYDGDAYDAADLLTYEGTSPLAESLLNDNDTQKKIEYYSYDENASNHCGTKLDSAPVNAGKYVAKLTITNSNYITVTKYGEFEIKKATLTVTPNSNISKENGLVNTVGSTLGEADAKEAALRQAISGKFTVEGYVNATDEAALDATVKSYVTLEVDDANWSSARGYYKNNPTQVADGITRYFLNAGSYDFALTETELDNYYIELAGTENKFTVDKLRKTSRLDLLYYMGDLGTSVPTTPGWNYDYFGRFDLTFNGESQVINILLGGNFDVDGNMSSADKNFYPYISPDDFTLTVSYGDKQTILENTDVNGMPKYTASVKNAGKYTLALTPTDNSVNVASIDLNEKELTVKPYNIGTDSLSKFEIVPKDKVCNGTEQSFEIKSITFDGVSLEEDTDYEIVYAQKGTAVASNYEYSIEGRGNFTGTYSGMWKITPVSASNITGISLDLSGLSDRIYNGEEVTLTESNVVADQNNSLAKHIVDSLVGGDVTYTFAPIVADFEDYAEITNWTTTAPINAGTYAVKAEIRSEQHTEAVIVYDKFTIAKATITVTPGEGISVPNGSVNTINDESAADVAKDNAIRNAVNNRFTISGIYESGADKAAIEETVESYVTLANPSWSGAKGYDYYNVTNEIDSTVRYFLDAGEYEFGLTCSEIDNYKIEIAENANKFVVNELDLSYSGNLEMIFYTDDPCDWNPYAALVDMTYSGYDQSLHILVGGNLKINDYDYFYPYIRSDEYTITIKPNKEGAVAQTLTNGSTGEGAMPSYVANVRDAGPYIITLTPAANSTNLTQNVVAKTLTVDPQTMENVIAAALDPNDNTSSVSWTLSMECNGQPQTMSIESLVYHGVTLYEGTDYTLQSDMQVNVNTLTDEITNYPFNIYAVVDSNFSGSYTGEWEITPATAANAKNGISFDIADKTFDGQAVVNPIPENLKVESGNDLAKYVKDNATNITTVYASVAANFDGDFTKITDWTATPVTVGKYAAKATVSGTQFAAFDIYDTFTISKATITINIDSVSKEFGTVFDKTNHTVRYNINSASFTYSGNAGAVNLADLKSHVEIDAAESDYKTVGTVTFLQAGTYNYRLTSEEFGDNYLLVLNDTGSTFEVYKKYSGIDSISNWKYYQDGSTEPIVVSSTAYNVNIGADYNGNPHTLTIEYKNSNNQSDYVDYVSDEVELTITSVTDAGTYYPEIKPKADSRNLAQERDNHPVTTGDQAIVWTIAQYVLTDDDLTLDSYGVGVSYNGNAWHPIETVKVDLNNDNTRETTLVKDTDYTIAYYKLNGNTETPINADELVNAGGYKVEVTGIGNYRGTDYKTYTIWKATQTVTVKPNTIVYDGKPVDASDFTVTSNAGNQMGAVTVTFYSDADGVYMLDPAPVNAGTYYVRASVEASDNYAADDSDYVKFTIAKRKVSITPASNNKVTYGYVGELDSTDLKYTVEIAQKNGNTGFVPTGDVSDEDAQAQAKTLFGDILTVGQEIETTNVQHPDDDDNYDVTIATNDAGTYEYEDFRSEKQIGEIIATDSPVIPFYGLFDYGYSFQLYSATEIGTVSAIDSLSYHVNTTNSLAYKFDIYLMDVDANFTFPNGYQNNFNVAQMTKVYSTEGYTFVTGWNELSFDKVYIHDPSKKLLVLFVNRTGAHDSNLSFDVYSKNSEGTIYDRNDLKGPYIFDGTKPYDAYHDLEYYTNVIKLGSPKAVDNYALYLSNPDNNVFTVEKKQLTEDMMIVSIDGVEKADRTVVFDSARHTASVTFSDKVGNTEIIKDTDVEVENAVTNAKQVHEYELTYVAAEDGNYKGKVESSWAIISKSEEGEITGVAEEYTYGETVNVNNLAVQKIGSTDTYSKVTYTFYCLDTSSEVPAYIELEGTPKDVGTYRVRAEVDQNGTIVTVEPVNFKIVPKQIALALDTNNTYTKVYDDSDPEFGYVLADGYSLVYDDTLASVVTGTIVRENAGTDENAGVYADATFTWEDTPVVNANYMLADIDLIHDFTITKRQITSADITINNKKNAYTGNYVNLDITVTVKGKTLTEGTDYDIDGYTRARKVGTYDFSVSAVEGSNYYTDDLNEPAEGEWEIVNTGTAVVKTMNAEFGGRLQFNVKFALPESLLNDENAYVEYTKNGETKKVLVSTLNAGTYKGETVYFVPVITNPKQIRDIVNFKIFTGEGLPVVIIDRDGNDCTEMGFNYSMVDYLIAIQAASSNPKMVALAKATYDYGTAAQIYFQYGEYNNLVVGEDIINFSDEQLSNLNQYAVVEEGSLPEGISKVTMNLNFVAEANINVKFTFTSTPDLTKYTCTIDGITAKLIKQSDTVYYLSVNNIAAKKLDTSHVFTISDGTNTYSTTRSALTYACLAANNSKTSLSNLGKATYLYNVAANEYFNDVE